MTHHTPLQSDTGKEYIAYCCRRLSEEYLPRVQRCVSELSEEDFWWRAHETDNSVGNLLLHLSGNIRQWIISGIGGMPDVRHRPQEFAEREHFPKSEVLNKFEQTVAEAVAILERFDSTKLLEKKTIQDFDVTCLDAISHVVEHVAQHLGQIIYITKLKTAKDLKFYNL
jgi:uncharacterized damage-inducible protein DinB